MSNSISSLGSLTLTADSDKKTGRATFARACIAAGMLALTNKGDIEFAISMFEKAITWYPENERLLEE